MFELNERYTLDMPAGSISTKGIERIEIHIRQQRVTEGEWLKRNPNNTFSYLFNLPDDWQWLWIVSGKGEYVGTFPKRVGKFYYKHQRLNCPPSFLTEIGNIARQHTEENPLYRFEFVDRFDWKAGDYGDSGSCFWGGNEGARDVIADNGGYAIRFYDSDDNGIGRAWIAPAGDGQYIVFNGYGFPGNPTLICARVFATFTGLSYKKIHLSNRGSESGLVWINAGIGYLVGQESAIESVREYDLEWGNFDVCCDCGQAIDGDAVYTGIDDEIYCENCYYDRFSDCDRCYETCYRDDMYYVEHDGRDVCSFCLNRYYLDCENCNEYYPREMVHEINDSFWCDRCIENHLPGDEDED